MNENLDLCEILKGCPKGTKLWSPVWGDVFLVEIKEKTPGTPIMPIAIKAFLWDSIFLSSNGKLADTEEAECVIFPSKDQRDWSKFKAPVKKFNPEEFKPFDCVLVRKNYSPAAWYPRFFNAIDITGGVTTTNKDELWACCVPYNDETKYLLGTTNDCPEFYKWWKK